MYECIFCLIPCRSTISARCSEIMPRKSPDPHLLRKPTPWYLTTLAGDIFEMKVYVCSLFASMEAGAALGEFFSWRNRAPEASWFHRALSHCH